jgi:hypothetical protein
MRCSNEHIFRRRQEIEDVYLNVMIIFGTPSTGNGNNETTCNTNIEN